MTDIVGRLLRWSFSTTSQPATDLMDEAAKEIARLRGRLRQKGEALEISQRCESVLLADYRNLSERWDRAIEELPHLERGGRLMEELEFLRKVVRRMAAVQEQGEQIPSMNNGTNLDAMPVAKVAELESLVPPGSGATPANTPVAWMFRNPDGSVKFVLHDADRAAAWGRGFNGTVIPLYERPQA